MCFAAGWNGFAGRIWPPPTVGWRTLIWTMKRRDDSTHHCRSPTPTMNGCTLTPSTRTQASQQEYSYLTASKRHPSTPYSCNTPQSFSRGTRPCTFPRPTKHVHTSLADFQDFSEIGWRLEICYVALRARRKPH